MAGVVPQSGTLYLPAESKQALAILSGSVLPVTAPVGIQDVQRIDGNATEMAGIQAPAVLPRSAKFLRIYGSGLSPVRLRKAAPLRAPCSGSASGQSPSLRVSAAVGRAGYLSLFAQVPWATAASRKELIERFRCVPDQVAARSPRAEPEIAT